MDEPMGAASSSSRCAAPLFCRENKMIWSIVRRFLIYLLRELDRAYGWETFGRK